MGSQLYILHTATAIASPNQIHGTGVKRGNTSATQMKDAIGVTQRFSLSCKTCFSFLKYHDMTPSTCNHPPGIAVSVPPSLLVHLDASGNHQGDVSVMTLTLFCVPFSGQLFVLWLILSDRFTSYRSEWLWLVPGGK
jgi:hypothetical protein